MNSEVPLTHTCEGNVPSAELEIQAVWEGNDDYIKCTVNYYRQGRFVRNDAYVYSKHGVVSTGEAASLPGN